MSLEPGLALQTVDRAIQECQEVREGRVRKQLVPKLDAQVAAPGERFDGLDAACVRARDDAVDRACRDRLGKLTRIRPAEPVETARPIEVRRRPALARARVSE